MCDCKYCSERYNFDPKDGKEYSYCICLNDDNYLEPCFAEDGLAPGRIVIYRQGSVAPSVIQPDVTPYSVYGAELKRIEEEIANIRIEFQNNVLEATKNDKS